MCCTKWHFGKHSVFRKWINLVNKRLAVGAPYMCTHTHTRHPEWCSQGESSLGGSVSGCLAIREKRVFPQLPGGFLEVFWSFPQYGRLLPLSPHGTWTVSRIDVPWGFLGPSATFVLHFPPYSPYVSPCLSVIRIPWFLIFRWVILCTLVTPPCFVSLKFLLKKKKGKKNLSLAFVFSLKGPFCSTPFQLCLSTMSTHIYFYFMPDSKSSQGSAFIFHIQKKHPSLLHIIE